MKKILLKTVNGRRSSSSSFNDKHIDFKINKLVNNTVIVPQTYNAQHIINNDDDDGDNESSDSEGEEEDDDSV